MHNALVVDESPIIRRILGIMLGRLGFATVEADCVRDALVLCERSLPEVALIDWTLPDQDGIALLQQLRRLPGGEKVKLIMCTVERSVTQIETALAAGADEYITKPFGIEVLETKLGYLGFTLPETDDMSLQVTNPGKLSLRRNFSRIGFAGMTVAENEEARFAAGDIIFRHGDMPDYAYILLSGTIRLHWPRDNGAPLDLSCDVYDLVGELALIETTPRPFTAIAESDCSMMRISRSRFQAELELLSPFMRNWIESLTGRWGASP